MTELNAAYVKDKIAAGIVTTIAEGETTSDVKNLGGCTLIAMITPAGFDGDSITVKGGDAEDDLLDCYSSFGTQVIIAAGPSRRILLSAYDFRAVKFIQLVADAQSADCPITLIPGDI